MARPSTKPATGLLSRGSIPTSLVFSATQGHPSPHTRRSYERGIAEMYAFANGRPVTLTLLMEWRLDMMKRLAPATVNARIMAARALIREARRTGFIGLDEFVDLNEIGSIPFRGDRKGNWLTVEQLRRLLSVPNRKDLRGCRNYLILALLAGCALRLDELAKLNVETVQMRDGRAVLIDLIGKGGTMRTVAVPGWVKAAIDAWVKAARITEGRLVRQLTLSPKGLSTKAIQDIVRKAAEKIGVPKLRPHDLRRTCAKLCKEAGGDIEQIQAMLGHASINTTQRYLGTTQNLREAVNDKMGL